MMPSASILGAVMYALCGSQQHAVITGLLSNCGNASGGQDVQSRWLLAQCCMSMNKYTEAEHALNPNNDGTDVRPLATATLQTSTNACLASGNDAVLPLFCMLKQLNV